MLEKPRWGIKIIIKSNCFIFVKLINSAKTKVSLRCFLFIYNAVVYSVFHFISFCFWFTRRYILRPRSDDVSRTWKVILKSNGSVCQQLLADLNQFWSHKNRKLCFGRKKRFYFLKKYVFSQYCLSFFNCRNDSLLILITEKDCLNPKKARQVNYTHFLRFFQKMYLLKRG